LKNNNMKLHSIGVDLSKNHFGLCHLDINGKTNFVYCWFKPYLKRDKATTFHTFELTKEVETKDFKYREMIFKYDDKTHNQILVDGMKSKLFTQVLKDFISDIEGPKFVSLEDYVTSGQKVIQLVHISESFKYFLAELGTEKEIILFLCPNVTWKKYLCPGLKVRSDDKKKPYKMIDACLTSIHQETKKFLDSLEVKQDIYKDLVDAYGLAYVYKSYDQLFIEKYKKRLFIL